ncbi:Amidase domain-containing protein [Pseudomonas marginalis]
MDGRASGVNRVHSPYLKTGPTAEFESLDFLRGFCFGRDPSVISLGQIPEPVGFVREFCRTKNL